MKSRTTPHAPRDGDPLQGRQPAEASFYEARVAAHLPPRLLDFHAHVWRRTSWKTVPWDDGGRGARYMVTADDYPVESLVADARKAFPDREYRAVCFGDPGPRVDNDRDTAATAQAGRTRGMYPLVVAGAELQVEQGVLRRRIVEGNFLGYKVFLNWQGDDYGDKRVQDMLGANEMDLADQLGLVVLLHVPRAGRLADPEIQQGVQWLARRWPRARIVLAHCGRCYLPEEMAAAVGCLRDLPNVWMDTAMVMDETVLRMAFDTLGPGRLLFATDFPVAAMRGRRVRVMDHWVDIVEPGHPASAWRVPAKGIPATFMAVEIAAAILGAARAAGLSREQTDGVFYGNGMQLLAGVDGGRQIRKVEEAWRP